MHERFGWGTRWGTSWGILVVVVAAGRPQPAAAESPPLPPAGPIAVRTQLRSLVAPLPSGGGLPTSHRPCAPPAFLPPFEGPLTFRQAYRSHAHSAFRSCPRWSQFGLVRGGKRFHGGIDVAAVTGTPIRAAVDGTLGYAREAGGYGLFARLTFDAPKRATDGTCTADEEPTQIVYAHLLDDDPHRSSEPRMVRAGDIIGRVGCSGNARGMCSPSPESHVHITVQLASGSKTRFDPVAYLGWAITARSDVTLASVEPRCL